MSNNDFPYLFDSEWRQSAACKDMNTTEFFPERLNKTIVQNLGNVYNACKSCPVAAHCLQEAVNFEYDGIWAFTSFKQRLKWKSVLQKKGIEKITLEDAENFLYNNLYKESFYKTSQSLMSRL